MGTLLYLSKNRQNPALIKVQMLRSADHPVWPNIYELCFQLFSQLFFVYAVKLGKVIPDIQWKDLVAFLLPDFFINVKCI